MAKRSRPIREEKPNTAAAIFRSLRIHQWVKNGLVFVPLVLGGLIGEYDAWSYASLGFLALSLAASASYILNDIRDIESDRRHRSKRDRPFASGALSIRAGYVLAAALLVAAFGVGALIGPEEMVMLAIYTIAALSYTLYWKRIPVFDIFVLASLFTFRIALGILILDVRISPWLMIFSMFVFLSLSAAKRHTELGRNGIGKGEYLPGRGYLADDAPLLLGLGLAAMLGAVLINIVYLLEDAFPRAVYGNPIWLWSVPPVIFLFLGRIWLLSQRGLLLDDPVAFALKDRVSLSLAFVGALGFTAALIGLPTPT